MARFICEICMHEVDPKQNSVLHLVTGWVKGATNNVKKLETNHYRYVHEICQPREEDQQLPLF